MTINMQVFKVHSLAYVYLFPYIWYPLKVYSGDIKIVPLPKLHQF